MPKMKSNRALMKRIKITGTGKIKHKHAYTGHLAPNKTTKQKNHLQKKALIDKTDQPRISQMIYYKSK